MELPKPPGVDIGPTLPLPAPPPPWLDPVLAAKQVLHEMQMARLPQFAGESALDRLARLQGVDVAELARQAAERAAPAPQDVDLDNFITSATIEAAYQDELPLVTPFNRGKTVAGGGERPRMRIPGVASGAGTQFRNASLETKRKLIKYTAQQLGLTITATTNGKHTPGSWHYKNQAIDVGGPPDALAKFFRAFERLAKGDGVIELFYDPLGAYNDGQKIPPVGNHGTHVHIAFAPPKA